MTEEEKKQFASNEAQAASQSQASVAPAQPQSAQQQTAITPETVLRRPQSQPDAMALPQGAEVEASSKVDKSRPADSQLAPVAPTQTQLNIPAANPAERREEMEYMVCNKPMGDDEAKERRRNRARSFVAAIGDGVSALANLYYTTQYAPNANLQPSLSKQNKERFDKRMEEFRARKREYEAGLQRAKDRDKDNNRYAQEWKYRMQQAAQQQAERQRAAAAKVAADKAAEARRKEEMELKRADAAERRRHNEAMERNGARTAHAAEVRASKSGSNKSSEGNKAGGYTITRKDLGTVATYPNAGEWERAARNDAKELNVATTDTAFSAKGLVITQHSAPRLVSDVEKASAKKAEEEAAAKKAEQGAPQKKKSPTGNNGKAGKKSPTS